MMGARLIMTSISTTIRASLLIKTLIISSLIPWQGHTLSTRHFTGSWRRSELNVRGVRRSLLSLSSTRRSLQRYCMKLLIWVNKGIVGCRRGRPLNPLCRRNDLWRKNLWWRLMVSTPPNLSNCKTPGRERVKENQGTKTEDIFHHLEMFKILIQKSTMLIWTQRIKFRNTLSQQLWKVHWKII